MRALLLAALAGAACAPAALFTRGRAAVKTGAATPASECGRCHQPEHEAWGRSRHAQAWTDPLFRASFARARMRGWCRNCHVPLEEQQAVMGARPDDALVAEGITCAVCHLRDGVVLASRAPSPDAGAAHAIREEPALRSAAFCGGCHQFAQPVLDELPLRDTAVWAQSTLLEWERSGARASCQGCHFDTHESGGGHDLARLREALVVQLAQRTLSLRLKDVGHRVPTGDPFRQLVLEACAGSCEAPLASWRFRRTFELQGALVRERGDTRLTPGEVRTVTLPDGATRWRLRLIYAEPGLEERVAPEHVSALISEGAL